MDEMKRINDAAERCSLSAVRLKSVLFWAAGLGDYAEALEDAVKICRTAKSPASRARPSRATRACGAAARCTASAW